MKKIALAFPLLFFAVIFAFFWLGLGHDPRNLPSALLNKPTPTLAAHSLVSKKKISNKIFTGHITLMTVWASDCYPCLTEHHVLMGIRADKQNQGLQIVGLNYKDNPRYARQLLTKFGNPYNDIIDDQDGRVGMDFGVYGTPETYIIDKKGVIRYRHAGELTAALWQTELLPTIQKIGKEL